MLVKAKEGFGYYKSGIDYLVEKNAVIDIDEELAKDFIRQGLVEIYYEVKEVKEIKNDYETKEVKKTIGGRNARRKQFNSTASNACRS